MRIFSIITAVIVVGALYMLVIERERLMEFVGVEATAQTPDDAIETAAEPVAQNSERIVSVVVKTSKAQNIDSTILLRGRTEAARQVTVQAETSGLVASDPLRKGQYVEAGQLLCEIDPGTRLSALAEAQARVPEAESRVPEAEGRLAEAKARLTEAEINDNAAKQLSEDGFASSTRVASTRAAVEAALAGVQAAMASVNAASAGIEAAEASLSSARKEIGKLKISAPFAGLLETDTAELGSFMQPGTPCASIIQLDPIKLVGFVPEADVDRVEIDAFAIGLMTTGSEVLGKVTFVSRSSDPETRTFRVEVTVPNKELKISDGQTAEIFVSAEGQNAHLLPASALTLNNDGALGVRIAEGDTAAFRSVNILRDTIDGIWVSNLPDVVDVIVVGQEYVTSGVKIKTTNEKDISQ
ncbi:MAG: efflux RND transporter periplasmic adaptor subunit [Litoreibacter sp.]